ncbi:MAG: subtype B tannase [Faecousia sp.]
MNSNLLFPVDQYSVKTQHVEAENICHDVEYKEYRCIPYCANPVDPDFQSMDVYVPVRVDGKEVDTTDAPIFVCNQIQAYTSWNIRTNQPGMPHAGMLRETTLRYNAGGPSGPGGRPPLDDGNRKGRYGKPFLPLYAMSQGLVVVKPGARGRENQAPDGTYFGKAPAAVVDLKACVRYIRHNKGVFPGDTDKIFSNGGSAGGAISAALGASADCADFEPYLKKIGAAEESDAVLGTICHCPITDLDHFDMAYEWMYGPYPGKSGLVDQEASKYLAGKYEEYIRQLHLVGKNDFGPVTPENLREYIVKEYLSPSAKHYLTEELNDSQREAYLKEHPWLHWDGKEAAFCFEDITAYIGRMKGLASSDASMECSLFGNETTDIRHFTDFIVKRDNPEAEVEPEVRKISGMINPFTYVRNHHPGCCDNWYFCVGTKDNHSSHSVSVSLATLLENMQKNVSFTFLWDYGHNAEDDPVEMVDWIWRIAGQQ